MQLTNQQIYLAIGLPIFAVFLGTITIILIIVWQSRGLEKRIGRLENIMDRIQSDLKGFYQETARTKTKNELE